MIAPGREPSRAPGPVLVDTSVWIDHLRGRHATLAARLEAGEVLTHPFVIGELACGHLTRRGEILGLLTALPAAPLATHDEALRLVDEQRLAGLGLGWIDVHLLAAALLAPARLWTNDQALAAAATRLGVG